MLLFPPPHSPTLNYRMRGGDTARYADRVRFAQAGNVSTAYKKDEWVTIIYQRAPLREKIKSVYIQIYPHRIEYTFNFIFNRRPVTMKVDHETLKKWNTPEPPPVPHVEKPKKRKKKVDRFQCEWGVCRLDKHPDMPARWAARISRNEGVIELEAVCDSTRKEQAHVKYLKFRGLLRLIADLDELPLTAPVVESGTSLLDLIDKQEYEKEAKKASKSKTKAAPRRADPPKAKTHALPPKRGSAPKLRIRSYAA